MQTQNRVQVKQIAEAIKASQKHLLAIQKPDGYWWAELESNVTITAEAVLLHKIWGTDKTRPLHKVETYLRSQQREHGGWELFYGDGGELSTTVEAYMALRLLGVPANDPALIKAKSWILEKGGISKTRIFTKLHLALIGCYNWRGLPSLPSWVMLLPDNFPFNIYELSSWARSSTVPLLIVFDRKPIFKIDQPINLDELYTEGVKNVKWELPKNGDWSDIFNILDNGFKLAESFNFVPFRNEGIKAAEKWILERQEATGDWGGIIPAMLNSLLALKCLDYDANDPIIYRGLKAVDNFAIETENSYCVQPCVSPVWDTAWAIRALIDSGFPADDPAIIKAGEWLLEKQILDYGDWSVKNKQGKPGAWAFEFDNRFYPDVDDSAVVVMALHQTKLPNEELKKQAINRALNWIASMQCQPGGWAAFDIDNNQDWLNSVPYGDLKAMIDPNTADVTARVLEMLGACNLSIPSDKLEKSLDYLLNEQEKEGCWFGRWGVNYIYGTSGVLSALALINPQKYRSEIEQGAAWLVKVQNSDGGWGETCFSYNDPSLKGKGDSTASQTAWGLIGLIAAGEATVKIPFDSIERGINYLLETQRSDGTWDESYFTGTGFPCHFYLKYHLYQQYFPLIALGRYQGIKG
ncbi:squalene--hopene cyclase [Anabaena cylindrica FACHB-243]|uniref:Squalene-hopene cyclase n=1 Tax=Anabaena cylindrica (strain ATCC 27899 / PCC 7122) TaxID=272123 RepID=K9ZMR9_ANACC|nr:MULTISPECIES: squalene--hopene cyclase [Anabaena]AFZ60533.1 squalene-hopene cyclase [Anabaena cylindrica PCC 7122]MBD2418334.1 squalene--hopene cyclase [Anabaena cylindrica FACHB-243]MBY5285693.1 squalene--hopene cyclase [Anabaena sp. CCAP 1446/1C]MBY5308976.1 squalene--hopene cyclase [Anabaena sp. CCAP 1446/1C]MCM2409966.1 squalene--hopene cyclase [Anabaena sp. CCAP 1446/1C]